MAASEFGENILGQSIDEELLLRVAAHVGEGENRYGGFDHGAGRRRSLVFHSAWPEAAHPAPSGKPGPRG